MFRLGSTQSNLANVYFNKSTQAKFYLLTRNDKDLLGKIREDMFDWPSIVFKRKVVVDKTFVGGSTKLCQSIVGSDASQLYPFFMCQAIPTGLYARWELNSESGKVKPCQNETRSFENKILSYLQRVRPYRDLERLYLRGKQKKNDAFSVDSFGGHCSTVFEAMGCY